LKRKRTRTRTQRKKERRKERKKKEEKEEKKKKHILPIKFPELHINFQSSKETTNNLFLNHHVSH